MKEFDDKQIVEQYIKVIKEKRIYSNCPFMPHQLEEKVQCGNISAYELKDAFLLIENKRALHYLYFFSNSWEWLGSLDIIKIKYQQVIISIVQKQIENTEAVFLEKGFSVYKVYQRLRSKGNFVDSSDIDYCNIMDKSILKQMMECTFDVFSDHVPTDEELEVFLERKQIICVREKGKVTGFVIFENKGKTSYIRMVCIEKKYQGKGLANELMKMYFKIHGNYASFTLWYDMKNSIAHSLYSKWNYADESLYNLIYVI